MVVDLASAYTRAMGFKKKWRKSPPALVELFDSILPEGPGIERRQMFGYPCAFLNGNMFTGLHQENMILRLAESDRQVLCQQHGAELFQPFGKDRKMTMREYVALPRVVMDDPAALERWLVKSLHYVSSLPPKNRL